MYKCPYCNKDKFKNWISVRAHTSCCDYNDKKYMIDEILGPLDIAKILKAEIWPDGTKTSLTNFRKKVLKLGYILPEALINRKFYKVNKERCIDDIKRFFKEQNRIPTSKDFESNKGYLDAKTIKKYFGSWNKGIEAAGFVPNIQNGYGINTVGKDGHLYRSNYEALFADKFLYGKCVYIIEPKYPKPYFKYYDWHIPELNIYIELDGGIRPQITKEKININIQLGRKCLFIKVRDILTKESLDEFCNV